MFFILTAGDSFILGYVNDTKGIKKVTPNNEVIIFDDFTTSCHLVNFDFKIQSSAMKILTPRYNDNIIVLLYILKGLNFKPFSHKRHYITDFQNFDILLPPLKRATKNRQLF
ncbi:restriction endonuclease S subunit [Helicobacter cetorum]|uniref:Restriction endonuclease S subunit n=1 Tax=Helicobacter cetorum (strain ATCC BAA-429 / MIT 00-7128) TaxID=182217 RepID=I0EPA5_HELC0|nr:restriction endonuclease S subunit [Helicobacter cetorum]AFI04774.1 restriction endonuclease S subunit [Helicobacter cetorum MIT 00-7128]